MPEVINDIWKFPPPHENQWCVMIGGVVLTINSKSHQQAKTLSIEYLCLCCKDPSAYKQSIMKRINEVWRGGISARLVHRGTPIGTR